jgi:hypothetical protein
MAALEPGWNPSRKVRVVLGLPLPLAHEVAERAQGREATSSTVIAASLERALRAGGHPDIAVLRNLKSQRWVRRSVMLDASVNARLQQLAKEQGVHPSQIAAAAVYEAMQSTQERSAVFA